MPIIESTDESNLMDMSSELMMAESASTGVLREWRQVRGPQSWLELMAPNSYQWHVVELPIAGLPDGLSGLRLLHVTDLHFRPEWSPAFDRIIADINAVHSDLILMTGDFVEKKKRSAPSERFVERFFSPLRSRLGNFAIFGNHDHDLLCRFARRLAGEGVIPPEPWPVRSAQSDHWDEPIGLPVPPRLPPVDLFGHRLLDDHRQCLEYQGATIELIGFRGTARADFSLEFMRSVPPKPANAVRIVLTHHPDSVRHLTEIEPDVVLAGHTHGGQICLPGSRPLLTHDSLPKEMVSGVHRFENTWLVVSRGLGFSSIPVRVCCPPEIIEIRLVKD